MLVEVDADKHPEHAQDVDLHAQPEDELDQDEIDREGRVDARCEVRREDALDSPLGCHNVENFSKDSAKQAADQHKHEEYPGRFSHAAA